ncbi:LPS translocon maturation chaperone LptM [Vreelandella sp. TE19]
MKALVSITLIALLLAGCGQKGPLYQPDDNAQTAAEES